MTLTSLALLLCAQSTSAPATQSTPTDLSGIDLASTLLDLEHEPRWTVDGGSNKVALTNREVALRGFVTPAGTVSFEDRTEPGRYQRGTLRIADFEPCAEPWLTDDEVDVSSENMTLSVFNTRS